MRNILQLAVLALLLAVRAPGAAGVVAADDGAGELVRLERAYAQGLRKAEDEAARLECLRARNAALAMLVDRTYQSTLAWLSDNPDLVEALQQDQGLWQERLRRIVGAGDSGGEESMEQGALMLLERMRVLTAITSGTVLERFQSQNDL